MADQQTEPNYVKEAFQWQYNLIGLGGAVAASVISLNPLPIILAAGVELMYLATVPAMPRFQRLIRSRQFELNKDAHDENLKKMLYALPQPRSAISSWHSISASSMWDERAWGRRR